MVGEVGFGASGNHAQLLVRIDAQQVIFVLTELFSELDRSIGRGEGDDAQVEELVV